MALRPDNAISETTTTAEVRISVKKKKKKKLSFPEILEFWSCAVVGHMDTTFPMCFSSCEIFSCFFCLNFTDIDIFCFTFVLQKKLKLLYSERLPGGQGWVNSKPVKNCTEVLFLRTSYLKQNSKEKEM